MAGEVLAHELGLPLLRVEVAELEGSLVGETEARLHELFRSVKNKPSVLLLDEADTMLMERGKTTGSTQHYQNTLVNQWLRELDRFEGILVLTTNMVEALDPAAIRRIQFTLAFELPNAEVRAQIWSTMLGNSPIPGREGLDLHTVADRYPISGGRIRNVFLAACQKAAVAGAISQAIVLEACEEELRSALPGKRTKQIRGFASLA
jgi:SpoVK/Ycf46/Vps4 family AAA+-type ATPase